MIGFELVNGSTGDPCVYVRVPFTRDNAMLDCGLSVSVPTGQLVRVAHVFLSHSHIDHAIGLDWLVRANLTHDKVLNIHGPEPLTEQLRSRLRGYTWNLDTTGWVTIACHEIGDGAITTSHLRCDDWFRTIHPVSVHSLDDDAIPHPHLGVRFARLEHRVTSIAYCLQAPPRINVAPDALARAGLTPGPWLRDLKARAVEAFAASNGKDVAAAIPPDETMDVDGRALPSARLVDDLLTIEDGYKLAYVTDTSYTPTTRKRITALARNADVLLCEAVFSAQHEDTARSTCHLTAEQAGRLAAEADVRELVLFHFSSRYADDYSALLHEARAQFANVRACGIE